jgi:hypothetical protein
MCDPTKGVSMNYCRYKEIPNDNRIAVQSKPHAVGRRKFLTAISTPTGAVEATDVVSVTCEAWAWVSASEFA